MRSIQVDKGGFGYFGLFNPKKSTKNTLVEANGMDGVFLDETKLRFQKGDTTTIRTPFKMDGLKGHTFSYVRIYEVTDNLYKAEFIEKNEL
jgi:hypothetical protein